MQKQSFLVTFSPQPAASAEEPSASGKSVRLPYATRISELHYHDRYEIGVCEKGEGMFLSDDGLSYLSRGDVIFVARGVRHYSRSLTADEPCICRFVYLSAKKAEQLIALVSKDETTAYGIVKNAGTSIPTVMTEAKHPKSALFIKEILEICESDSPNRTESADLRLALFLLDAYTASLDKEAPQVKERPSRAESDKEIAKVAEYLAINYDRSDSVKDLARLCHLSESQFNKRFVKAYGISPKAYKTSLRCKVAADLLRRTKLSVQGVAARVGYADVSDFFRAFKRLYRLPPTAYRSAEKK